jgi:hypothetical protein
MKTSVIKLRQADNHDSSYDESAGDELKKQKERVLGTL